MDNIAVTASLEGLRVVVEGPICRLEEYNFSVNEFDLVSEARWPVSGEQVCQWLKGWNRIDKFRAVSLLMSPEDPKRLSILKQDS
jgi:hypothetical protein